MAKEVKLYQEDLEERIGHLLGSQREFIFSPERFSAIAGGFGSGKTRAGVLKGLILSHHFPGNQGFIGRFHGKDLEDSTIPVFFEVVPPSWVRSWNKKQNLVTLLNGSQIYFRHIHDPNAKGATKSRRVGANLGWFFLDQMEELSEEHWNTMISRLRLPLAKKKFGFGALNPAGHDWNWKFWFQGFREEWKENELFQVLRPKSDFLGIAVNSEENRISNGGFVEDDYYDSMIQNYPPEWVARYVRSSFRDFSGKIYKDYNASFGAPTYASVHNIEPFSIPKHWDLIVGIDVGGDSPWAIVPNYIDEWGNTIVVPGFVKPSVNTAEVAAWIKTHTPWNEPRTSFLIDPENKLAMLELAEFGIHARPAQKAVLPGIIRTGGYFHINRGMPLPPWYAETQPTERVRQFMGKGSPRTFVFNTFTQYMKEHETYVWDENKTNTPRKTNTERFDTCDADRYVKFSRPQASALRMMPNDHSKLWVSDALSAREAEAMDKRIMERVNRTKGTGLRDIFADDAGDTRKGKGQNYEW